MTPIGVNSVNMRLWVNMWVNMPSLDLTWSWNVEDAERSRSSSILEIPCKFSCRPNPAPLQRPVRLSELCVVIRSYLIVGLVTQILFSVLLFHKWPFEPSDFWPSRSRRMKSLGKTRESGGDGSLLCPPGKQSFLVCFNKKRNTIARGQTLVGYVGAGSWGLNLLFEWGRRDTSIPSDGIKRSTSGPFTECLAGVVWWYCKNNPKRIALIIRLSWPFFGH